MCGPKASPNMSSSRLPLSSTSPATANAPYPAKPTWTMTDKNDEQGPVAVDRTHVIPFRTPWTLPTRTYGRRRRIVKQGQSVMRVRRAAGAAAGPGMRVGLGVLDLEGVAAAAGGDGVRVLDLEARLLEPLEVVDRDTAEVRRAERVDDDADALDLELDVALGGAGVEAKAVLEAGAAAALDRDAEHRRLALGLLGLEAADLRRRERRQRQQLLGLLHGGHGLMVADR